jgi:hypothetical protein
MTMPGDASDIAPQRPAEPRPVPLSIALLNRRSVGGAIVVALCALFFIVVLPAVEDAIEEDGLSVGVPLAVGENLTVTPSEEWVLSDASDTDFTTLTNGGAQMIITPAVEVDAPVAAQIQDSADALADDPDNSWVVAEPTTFTTTAGDAGASVTAQSKESVTQVWIVSDGTMETTLLLTSPVAVWDGIADSAAQIAASVRFTEEQLP